MRRRVGGLGRGLEALIPPASQDEQQATREDGRTSAVGALEPEQRSPMAPPYFEVPLGMLDLPHPLSANDVQLQRVGGRLGHVEKHHGAPVKHHHDDAEGHDRPEDLDGNIALDRHAILATWAAPVLHRKDNDGDKNQRREENRHRAQKVKQRVDALWETLGL